MKYPLIGFALLMALAATPSTALTNQVAQDATNASIGTLIIQDAFTRPTPGGATVAVGYMAITNDGAAPDRLVAVTSDMAAKTEIHESKMQNGVMEMRELTDGLVIAPGDTVDLKPGGNHIMFLNIKQPVKVGDIIHATLSFENAGQVQIGFKATAGIGATSAGQ